MLAAKLGSFFLSNHQAVHRLLRPIAHRTEIMRSHLNDNLLQAPIGETSVMHTHNTFPSMAQYYQQPMWKVLDVDNPEKGHINTLNGSKSKYYATRNSYKDFCNDLISHIELLG